MLEWLLGKNTDTRNTTHRKVIVPVVNETPSQQDSIDMLIRKIVPEEYREKVSFTIYDNNIKYSLIIVSEKKKYNIRIWNVRGQSYYSWYVLKDQETCLFINKHFDEIIKKLMQSIETCKHDEQERINEQIRKEQKANEEKIRYQMCQNNLREKVITYCNQKV